MLLASQNMCGYTWKLYKVKTEEGYWVAFSPDQNNSGKYYVYDYTSSDEIKIVMNDALLEKETIEGSEYMPIQFNKRYNVDEGKFEPSVSVNGLKLCIYQDSITFNGSSLI